MLSFLAERIYFRDLDQMALHQVASVASPQRVGRGQILALEGEPCRAVYLVMSGCIQALKMSPEGREQIIGDIGPGEFLYLVPALDDGPLPVTTRALSDTMLLSFALQDFLALLSRYPSISLAVLQSFARRLRQMAALIEDLSLRSVSQRLAKLLLRWAESPNRRRMTQREMAAQLGTVREVVARTLSQFESEGWIVMQRGRIQVRNLQALRCEAGEM